VKKLSYHGSRRAKEDESKLNSYLRRPKRRSEDVLANLRAVIWFNQISDEKKLTSEKALGDPKRARRSSRRRGEGESGSDAGGSASLKLEQPKKKLPAKVKRGTSCSS